VCEDFRIFVGRGLVWLFVFLVVGFLVVVVVVCCMFGIFVVGWFGSGDGGWSLFLFLFCWFVCVLCRKLYKVIHG